MSESPAQQPSESYLDWVLRALNECDQEHIDFRPDHEETRDGVRETQDIITRLRVNLNRAIAIATRLSHCAHDCIIDWEDVEELRNELEEMNTNS